MGLHRRIDALRRTRAVTQGLSSVARLLSAITFAMLALATSPVAPQPMSGFNLCVPPTRPSCVFDPSSKPSPDGCEREVTAYIQTVFRYRECLEKQSERAVRESNDVIDHWRCRKSGERCRR
jgi:hypothetical protein